MNEAIMDISSVPLMAEEAVKSPCINICEPGSDNICKGCFRTLEEIASWRYASMQERSEIVSKAKQRQLKVIDDRP